MGTVGAACTRRRIRSAHRLVTSTFTLAVGTLARLTRQAPDSRKSIAVSREGRAKYNCLPGSKSGIPPLTGARKGKDTLGCAVEIPILASACRAVRQSPDKRANSKTKAIVPMSEKITPRAHSSARIKKRSTIQGKTKPAQNLHSLRVKLFLGS
jgi:hypothetical protein